MSKDEEQTTTDAVIAMIEAMSVLRKSMNKKQEIDALRRPWDILEREVLSLIDVCDAEMLMHFPELLEAESTAILDALPSKLPGPLGLSSKDVRRLSNVLPAPILARAASKGIMPGYNTATLLVFRPGEEDWTRYLEEEIAPKVLLCGPIGHILWDPKYLQSLDPERVARVLRVQVDHFPEKLGRLMTEMFFFEHSECCDTLVALFIAGIKPTSEVRARNERVAELLAQMTSNHGALEILRQNPCLEDVLARACTPDPNSDVTPPVTEEIL
jgi:hypothetical protein